MSPMQTEYRFQDVPRERFIYTNLLSDDVRATIMRDYTNNLANKIADAVERHRLRHINSPNRGVNVNQ